MGCKISLCKFHRNSVSVRLPDGKAVTLWDELTEHKAVSQKCSFQFLKAVISFFTIALYGLPNITLQISQEQLSERFLEGKAVTLWHELTEHRPVSPKTSFQFLMKIFSFSPSPSMVFQISLWILHKNSLSQRLLEGKSVTLWDELTEHKAVSQKASFRFLSEDTYFFTISL